MKGSCALCLRRVVVVTYVVVFLMEPAITTAYAQLMPDASVMRPNLTESSVVSSSLMRAVTIDPQHPLSFTFIFSDLKNQPPASLAEYQTMIKYFLAALTIPESELWVNLAPGERHRIMSENLQQTDMGMTLLAQDYLLKQLTSSLLLPQDSVGEQFWQALYDAAAKQGWSVDHIPQNVLHRVWVVPQAAQIYEDNHTGWLLDVPLDVLVESAAGLPQPHQPSSQTHISQQQVESILKQTIVPVIKERVNHGAEFAPLRQIVHAIMLAHWYKRSARKTILHKDYVNQAKTIGLSDEQAILPEQVYALYQTAITAQAHQIIKEGYDPIQEKMTLKQYVAGGFDGRVLKQNKLEMMHITENNEQIYFKVFASIKNISEFYDINGFLAVMKIINRDLDMINVQIAEQDIASTKQTERQTHQKMVEALKEIDDVKEKNIFSISPDNSMVATVAFSSESYFLKTRDQSDLSRLIKSYRGGNENSPITAITFSPDGQQLILGRENGGVEVFDIDDAFIKYKLDRVDYPVQALRFTPDGHTIVIVSGPSQDLESSMELDFWNIGSKIMNKAGMSLSLAGGVSITFSADNQFIGISDSHTNHMLKIDDRNIKHDFQVQYMKSQDNLAVGNVIESMDQEKISQLKSKIKNLQDFVQEIQYQIDVMHQFSDSEKNIDLNLLSSQIMSIPWMSGLLSVSSNKIYFWTQQVGTMLTGKSIVDVVPQKLTALTFKSNGQAIVVGTSTGGVFVEEEQPDLSPHFNFIHSPNAIVKLFYQDSTDILFSLGAGGKFIKFIKEDNHGWQGQELRSNIKDFIPKALDPGFWLVTNQNEIYDWNGSFPIEKNIVKVYESNLSVISMIQSRDFESLFILLEKGQLKQINTKFKSEEEKNVLYSESSYDYQINFVQLLQNPVTDDVILLDDQGRLWRMMDKENQMKNEIKALFTDSKEKGFSNISFNPSGWLMALRQEKIHVWQPDEKGDLKPVLVIQDSSSWNQAKQEAKNRINNLIRSLWNEIKPLSIWPKKLAQDNTVGGIHLDPSIYGLNVIPGSKSVDEAELAHDSNVDSDGQFLQNAVGLAVEITDIEPTTRPMAWR